MAFPGSWARAYRGGRLADGRRGVWHGPHNGDEVLEARFLEGFHYPGGGYARGYRDEELSVVYLRGDLLKHANHILGLDGKEDDVGVPYGLEVLVEDLHFIGFGQMDDPLALPV